VPRAAEGRKLALERDNLRPKNVLPMLQHGGHRLCEAVAHPLPLRREVDEGGNGLRAVFTHAISTCRPRRILAAERAMPGIEVSCAPGLELGRF
jgi:hypothetical protein